MLSTLRRKVNPPTRLLRLVLAVSASAALGAGLAVPSFTSPALGAPAATSPKKGNVLDTSAILAGQGLTEPAWYRKNIPFLDTPDKNIDDTYYYRWSTFKRALRYTTAGTGYISTEYDQPVWYSRYGSYSGLNDAAGYHILDGRWLRDRTYTDDYLDYWLRGAGVSNNADYSEWITSAAYQRYLVTGDASQLKAHLPQLIDLYRKWDSRLDQNISVNGDATSADLYWQTPLSDATEFTETSMHSTNWFSGGAGYRPTLNSYLFSAAQAISKVATMKGDTATATEYADRASALKQGVQDALWDPQRSFFMHVYNNDGTNQGIAGTRATWREAMGFAPWAFDLPDASYSSAWGALTDPTRFAGTAGPTTLERVHDFEAEQADVVDAHRFGSSSASNGSYVGQIDNADSAVTFTVESPGAGTYPVTVYYANGSGADSTHQLTVNDASTPIEVDYPAGGSWGVFTAAHAVTLQVPMHAGKNTLRFGKGTGYAEIDGITANPYFGFEAYPASQNRDDTNCCHWNAPTWPFATSQILTGMANLLQDYPAQPYVTKSTYDDLLGQFARLQRKDGKPYVAEAADPDSGDWVYDAQDFSENYNHSSFVDLVINGLLGLRPQEGRSLSVAPLVPDSWDYFALQSVPYHGRLLSIVWDRDGTHYGAGPGLQIFSNGKRIYQSATLDKATVDVGATITPKATTPVDNIAANANNADQEWLKAWDGRSYTATYPRAFASFTNPTSNGKRCRSSDNPRCVQTYDAPLKATNGFIGYEATPDDRWTNLGSSSSTDYLGVDFGAARGVRQVKVYSYDNGTTVRAPRSMQVQQQLDDGTWAPIEQQVSGPRAPVANGPTTVTFPEVTTSQIRVVFTPRPGKAVGVTELESWYPRSAPARIVNKNSGLSLAVAGASTHYGADVVQQTAGAGLEQSWQLEPAEDGWSKIENRNSGLLLGIQGASSDVGAPALQWGDTLTDDHLWRLVPSGDYVKLLNKQSGLLLGIRDASSADGAPALQWVDNGTDDHLWSVVR